MCIRDRQYVKQNILIETPAKLQVTPLTVETLLTKQREEDEGLIKLPKEIAFIGRSNAGKSSLINAMFRRKLSIVSKKPGCTKKLFFHELRNKAGFIVDCPGYGFTDARVSIKRKWNEMVDVYLRKSSRLCRIYLLLNIEHGIKRADVEALKRLQEYGVNLQPVLTKCDRIKDEQVFDRTLAIGQQLQEYKNISPLVIAVSSKYNNSV
eukprot:TRINITY_DN10099_c0_g1_i1.p1 TRINITY_DN10099_c0_g1~~TRINITY_DN10099_c0_g1_i1.p1  ORF type:complete len:227 (-),score=57.51 TRINITY_DN10099_c0_g1_i1:205-828(-)